MMFAKSVAWFKRHEYQWERDDFRRATNVLFFVLVGIAAFTGGGMSLASFYGDEVMVKMVLVIGFLFIGVAYGSIGAIRWADMRLKKDNIAGK